MKIKVLLLLFTVFSFSAIAQQSIYDFTMVDIDGNEVSLKEYKGKTVLIVNVASKCGLTPQYKDIEALYKSYKDKNFVVLGFPANNFLNQEPGSNAEIKEFCSKEYAVTFPMFEKISVKGNDIHPLYQYLTEKEKNTKEDAPVKWNFQKFLIDANGNYVQSFSPSTKVTDEDFLNVFNKIIKK